MSNKIDFEFCADEVKTTVNYDKTLNVEVGNGNTFEIVEAVVDSIGLDEVINHYDKNDVLSFFTIDEITEYLSGEGYKVFEE